METLIMGWYRGHIRLRVFGFRVFCTERRVFMISGFRNSGLWGFEWKRPE